MKIAFRVDASERIGSGHVMRCLTLADALTARGVDCHFICRDLPGNMIGTIGQRGYKVVILEAGPEDGENSYTGTTNDTGYQTWLGTRPELDAAACRSFLRQSTPDWLVVDHYALDAHWETDVKRYCGRLLVLDDLANRRHDCHLLLDQNWFGSKTASRYQGLVPEDCTCLLGPEYAMLRPEYAQLRRMMPPRDGIIRRVLIFLGGSDPTDQTGKVLDVLSQPEFQHLALDVVLGANHPSPDNIKSMADSRNFTTLHQCTSAFAGLMVRADLMIGAGGGTTWERMCLGLPSIVISIAENQLPVALSLMEEEYIHFLGSIEEIEGSDIARAVRYLMSNPDYAKKLSQRGQRLVQGGGCQLICNRIC